MELYDYSLWVAPAGLAIATVELIWHRRLLPLLLGIAGVPLGAFVGRVAWEWFAATLTIVLACLIIFVNTGKEVILKYMSSNHSEVAAA